VPSPALPSEPGHWVRRPSPLPATYRPTRPLDYQTSRDGSPYDHRSRRPGLGTERLGRNPSPPRPIRPRHTPGPRSRARSPYHHRPDSQALNDLAFGSSPKPGEEPKVSRSPTTTATRSLARYPLTQDAETPTPKVEQTIGHGPVAVTGRNVRPGHPVRGRPNPSISCRLLHLGGRPLSELAGRCGSRAAWTYAPVRMTAAIRRCPSPR